MWKQVGDVVYDRYVNVLVAEVYEKALVLQKGWKDIDVADFWFKCGLA